MATYVPGVDWNRIIDGKTLGAHADYYAINVLRMESLSHDQFCLEFPNAARELKRASTIKNKMDAFAETLEQAA